MVSRGRRGWGKGCVVVLGPPSLTFITYAASTSTLIHQSKVLVLPKSTVEGGGGGGGSRGRGWARLTYLSPPGVEV